MALDKHVSLEDRLLFVRLLGHGSDDERKVSETSAREALVTIAYDADEPAEIRTTAVQSISRIDKRAAFPFFTQFINYSDNGLPKYIREAAVTSIRNLQDSRALFPLVKTYCHLDIGQDDERRLGYRILEAIGDMRDPRAADWLKDVPKTDRTTERLAAEAYRRCRSNEIFTYTFSGSDQLLRKAREGMHIGEFLGSEEDLNRTRVRDFLLSECQDGICYATYVVVPKNSEKQFTGKSDLIIGPRRTEHVFVSGGADVLAAGEIGFDMSKKEVMYLDNHSGGYLPAKSSFSWAKQAISKAGVRINLSRFSSEYPAVGYCSEEFLSTISF